MNAIGNFYLSARPCVKYKVAKSETRGLAFWCLQRLMLQLVWCGEGELNPYGPCVNRVTARFQVWCVYQFRHRRAAVGVVDLRGIEPLPRGLGRLCGIRSGPFKQSRGRLRATLWFRHQPQGLSLPSTLRRHYDGISCRDPCRASLSCYARSGGGSLPAPRPFQPRRPSQLQSS